MMRITGLHLGGEPTCENFVLDRLGDHSKLVQQQRQLLVRWHGVHIEGESQHSSRHEGVDSVEALDLGLGVPFALLSNVVQGDLMASKIDRVEGLLDSRETFFKPRVSLAHRWREFMRKRDANLVDVDP